MSKNGKAPQRKRRIRSRRALLHRIGQLLSVLGILCLVFAAVFGIGSRMGPVSAHAKQQHLALVYLASGAGLLVLRWIAWRLQKYTGIDGRPRRAARSREPAPERIRASRDSGAVLILTLIVVALITALLLQVQMSSRMAHRRADSALRRTTLDQAAADGVRAAMQLLLRHTGQASDSTNSAWATPFELTTPEGISTRVRITDEQSRFDLNNLSVPTPEGTTREVADILTDLMILCGDFTSMEKVEALTDWLDKDEDGFRESAFYLAQDPPYGAANRVLYGLDELLSVHGFSREMFNRREATVRGGAFRANLVDCVTVLPRPRTEVTPVNVNTASRDVLLAVLGIEEEKNVDALLALRRHRALTSLDDAAMVVDTRALSGVQRYLAVRSDFFRVNGRAYHEGHASEIRALLRRNTAGAVEVLQWVLL